MKTRFVDGVEVQRGLQHDAWRLHQTVGAQVDGLSDQAGLRHRDQSPTRKGQRWTLDAGYGLIVAGRHFGHLRHHHDGA